MSEMPVKNTFIHFEEKEDDPAGTRKKPRTSSAPAPEVRGDGDAAAASASPEEPPPAAASAPEASELAAGRQRLRWADQEDDDDVRQEQGSASGSQVPEAQRGSKRSRSRDARSRSRHASDEPHGSRGSGPRQLDDQTRHQKRKNFIDEWKASEGYLNLVKRRRSGDADALQAPRTPDPDDRGIGKRKWENLTMVWRQAVREFGNAPEETRDEA